MTKIRVKTYHQKKDLPIKITRKPESIAVTSTFKGFTYNAEHGFVKNMNAEIVGWNVKYIEDFWKPYISRIWANGYQLPIGETKVIYVERR